MSRKRKLNSSGVPEDAEISDTTSTIPTFDELGLDARLLQAISKEKFSTPTPVQAKTIPLVLEGRDVLVHSKTGSGKTAAYVLPILHSILRSKARRRQEPGILALILVPTRELASQVTKVVSRLSGFCAREIQVANLAPLMHEDAQSALLATNPEIVVSTPARALAQYSRSASVVEGLIHLVIDEADLVLVHGYEDDLAKIVKLIPKGVQMFLASATLNSDVEKLQELFCRDPVSLNLQEEEKAGEGVSQYVVRCAEDEKFLLLFALFKLKLIKGKCIIFIGDIDRCYRVKLFLEQFGIKSCILNSELPINSRVHVIEEFNRDVYDIILATDETDVEGNHPDQQSTADLNADAEDVGAQDNQSKRSSEAAEALEPPSQRRRIQSSKPKQQRSSSKKDKEYGISRGIDFHNVACVLNFDLPTNTKSYTHRIGRTARANRTGIALSFVIPKAQFRKHKQLSCPLSEHDEEALALIVADQKSNNKTVEPYRFEMSKLDGFRYRVNSALKAASIGAIKEARIREFRQEVLKSARLQRHLEENPEDLKWLRHDTELRPAKVQPHLKQVPNYLVPKGAGEQPLADVGFVSFQKSGPGNRISAARARNKLMRKGKGRKAGGGGGRKSDPLKTFHAKRKR